MPCCFSSSLNSVISGAIISLKTFSFCISSSTIKIISASFFGILTLKELPTAIEFAPSLQVTKIIIL